MNGRRGWRAAALVALLLAAIGCAGPSANPAAADPDPSTAATSAAGKPVPAPASAPTQPAAPSQGPDPAVTSAPASPTIVATFDATVVPEASGIALSRTVAQRAYLVDDGLGLFVLDLASGALQPLAVSSADGRRLTGTDIEGVAVGPCGQGQAESCVYVGDIGDNRRRRDAVEIWRLPEPGQPPSSSAAAQVVRLAYPDGPHDAEALLVDDTGVPVIVTKAPFDERTGRTGATRVLRAPGFVDGTLVDLGELELPAPTTALFAGFVGNVVTAADSITGRVLLRTYDSVLLLEPPAEGGDLASLLRWTLREVAGAPVLPQAEGVALLADGSGYLTVSEGAGDVWWGPLPEPGPAGPPR